MSARVVIIWWAAAALLVAAAVATTLAGPRAATSLPVGDVAFPDLRAAPETVGEIRIDSGGDEGGTLTLVALAEGGWTLAERDGYPVAAQPVRRLVAVLADMHLLEAKTARPDRFARLAVEPVDAEGARSQAVRLTAADGGTLADLVVGDRVGRLGGFSEDGTYIRRVDDARAWLASGRLEVSTTVTDWLVRDIVDLPADRVVSVRVEPAGDTPYAIGRPDAESDFALTPPPGEGETVEPGAVQRLAGVLAGLTLEDVASVDEAAPGTPQGTIEVVTADGLTVTGTLVERDTAPWLSLSAVAAADAADETVAEAATLTDRWQGWEFRLPAFVASRLTAPREDLTVAVEPTDPTP